MVLVGVLVAAAGSHLHDSLDKNVQGFELLPDNALSHTPTQLLHQKAHTEVLREREGMELTPSPSMDHSALTTALKPSLVV